MKSLKWALILAIFLAGCCNVTVFKYPTGNRLDRIEHLQQSTVAFVRLDGENLRTICAGVWVDEIHIVTAKHCLIAAVEEDYTTQVIQTLPIIEVKTDDPELQQVIDTLIEKHVKEFKESEYKKSVGTIMPFKLYGEEPNGLEGVHFGRITKIGAEDVDLAVVTLVMDKLHGHVDIRREPMKAGEEIDITGHPDGEEWSYSHGFVSKNFSSKVIIQSPIYYGDSGGGAFDQEGYLVGICSEFSSNIPNKSYYLNSKAILDLLE